MVVTSDINTVEGVKTLFVETIKKFGELDFASDSTEEGKLNLFLSLLTLKVEWIWYST